MPREIPTCPPKPQSSESGKRSYDIELVTPMFGGGVVTRENDVTLPIRPTAIRGQLQFWWRATVGAQYETSQELRAAQSAIWGDTSKASRVQIRVEAIKFDNPKPCAQFERDHKDQSRYRSMATWNSPFNNTALPYALFPFQGQLAKGGKQIETEPAACIHRADFRLTVNCHKSIDFAKQVEPAIWAWVNFGGLGSRTRRGCGALKGHEVGLGVDRKVIRIDKELCPRDADDLKAAWLAHMPKLFPQREWPTLASEILVGSATQNAIDAWDEAVSLFKHYRQGVGFGRNGDSSKFPKRSYWPEPETIRVVTGQRLPGHEVQNKIPTVAFPRAELGLPIVFQFKDEDKRNPTNPKADPKVTVLYPNTASNGLKRERMASPLAIKPLMFQGGRVVPLIMRLNTPEISGIDLRHDYASLNLPTATLIRDSRLSNSPLAGSPSGSAIEAFLALARSKGFSEVSR